jgi:hypothetical protein
VEGEGETGGGGDGERGIARTRQQSSTSRAQQSIREEGRDAAWRARCWRSGTLGMTPALGCPSEVAIAPALAGESTEYGAEHEARFGKGAHAGPPRGGGRAWARRSVAGGCSSKRELGEVHTQGPPRGEGRAWARSGGRVQQQARVGKGAKGGPTRTRGQQGEQGRGSGTAHVAAAGQARGSREGDSLARVLIQKGPGAASEAETRSAPPPHAARPTLPIHPEAPGDVVEAGRAAGGAAARLREAEMPPASRRATQSWEDVQRRPAVRPPRTWSPATSTNPPYRDACSASKIAGIRRQGAEQRPPASKGHLRHGTWGLRAFPMF